MSITRSQFSIFAGAVSLTIQAFFVFFVAYLAHLFYRDVSLPRSAINLPTDLQNKVLYFSFLDFALSNDNGHNLYIFGEVSKEVGLFPIIGHDCEPCQKEVVLLRKFYNNKIRNVLHKPRFESDAESSWNVNVLADKDLYFEKPILDEQRALLPRFMFRFTTLPEPYLKLGPSLSELSAKLFIYQNEVMILAPAYWKNDGVEAYGDILPHSLLISVKPCEFSVAARTTQIFIGSLVVVTNDRVIVCDNFGPHACHL